MQNAGLAAKISPPILVFWALLLPLPVGGCGAPDLAFTDDALDAAASSFDGPANLRDAQNGAPRYIGGSGTVTASNSGTGVEDMTHAWDKDPTTKWFARATPIPWTAFQFSSGATHLLTSYALTSGNDAPSRDPKSWRLEGSNDASSWRSVDVETDQVFAGRNQKTLYPVVSSTAYGIYRFNVTANNGSPDFQVAEIELFGY